MRVINWQRNFWWSDQTQLISFSFGSVFFTSRLYSVGHFFSNFFSSINSIDSFEASKNGRKSNIERILDFDPPLLASVRLIIFMSFPIVRFRRFQFGCLIHYISGASSMQYIEMAAMAPQKWNVNSVDYFGGWSW